MVNLISSNSTTGVYITEDESSQLITNNAPNAIDLDSLTLGTEYIYFDDFVSLTESVGTPRNDMFDGWSFMGNPTTWLKTTALGGQNVYRTFTLIVNVTSTQQQNWDKFFDYYQVMGEAEKYLVRQWAATTFKQFSYNATLYKYTPVVITDYTISEPLMPGKDVQTLTINLVQANRGT